MSSFRRWFRDSSEPQKSDLIIKKISTERERALIPDRDYVSARIRWIHRVPSKKAIPRHCSFTYSRAVLHDAISGEAVFGNLNVPQDSGGILPEDQSTVFAHELSMMREVPYRGKLDIELALISIQPQDDDLTGPYLRLLRNFVETLGIGVQQARISAQAIEMGLDLLVGAARGMELEMGLAAEFDSTGIWVFIRAPASVADGLGLNEDFEAVDLTGTQITAYPYVVFSIEAVEIPRDYFQLPYIDQAHEELMDLLKEGRLNDAEANAFPYFRQICLTSPDLLRAHAIELVRKEEREMRKVLQARAVSTEEAIPTWTLNDLNLFDTSAVQERSRVATQAEYRVWYGTNRRPIDTGDHSKGYSAERDVAGVVHYGSCGVFIPSSHKIGSTGDPWWKQLFKPEDDRLSLTDIDRLDFESYWAAVGKALADAEFDDRDAVIFVHGYNVSFEEAALRTAQIGFDLSVRGAMAFFSWPSRGLSRGYIADEATIEASEGAITGFMSDFAGRSGARRVHIIAHSMGNRGVLRAVDRIAAEAQRRTGKPFDQIILAAADVDGDTFRQLANAYSTVANRTTLYVSRRDRAVGASHWLHDFPRVGLVPPALVLPGIDTVNVTDVDLTWLGHGYVAGARAVLTDMYALIKGNAPPHNRIGLRRTQNEHGEIYWLIGG